MTNRIARNRIIPNRIMSERRDPVETSDNSSFPCRADDVNHGPIDGSLEEALAGLASAGIGFDVVCPGDAPCSHLDAVSRAA